MCWILLTIQQRLTPVLLHIAQLKSKQIALRVIQQTVKEHVDAYRYAPSDWITWHYDQRGKVSGMELNERTVASATGHLIQMTDHSIQALQGFKIYIPISYALQSPFLNSIGPRVPVEIEPNGTTQVMIGTRMKQAGLNIVMVEVYAKVMTEISLWFPFQQVSENVNTEIPLSVSMVFGEVPQWGAPQVPSSSEPTQGKD